MSVSVIDCEAAFEPETIGAGAGVALMTGEGGALHRRHEDVLSVHGHLELASPDHLIAAVQSSSEEELEIEPTEVMMAADFDISLTAIQKSGAPCAGEYDLDFFSEAARSHPDGGALSVGDDSTGSKADGGSLGGQAEMIATSSDWKEGKKDNWMALAASPPRLPHRRRESEGIFDEGTPSHMAPDSFEWKRKRARAESDSLVTMPPLPGTFPAPASVDMPEPAEPGPQPPTPTPPGCSTRGNDGGFSQQKQRKLKKLKKTKKVRADVETEKDKDSPLIASKAKRKGNSMIMPNRGKDKLPVAPRTTNAEKAQVAAVPQDEIDDIFGW